MTTETLYFQIRPQSALMQLAFNQVIAWEAYKSRVRELLTEVGASKLIFLFNGYQGPRFVSFTKPGSPSIVDPCRDTFRKLKGGWYPKKSTPQGRAVLEKMEALCRPESVESTVLKEVGLSDQPCLFFNGHALKPTLSMNIAEKDILSPEGGVPDTVAGIISMPWHSGSPEILEKINAYNSSEGFNANLAFLSSTPKIFGHPEVVQITNKDQLLSSW